MTYDNSDELHNEEERMRSMSEAEAETRTILLSVRCYSVWRTFYFKKLREVSLSSSEINEIHQVCRRPLDMTTISLRTE